MPEIRLSCPTCSQRLAASTDALRTRMSCPRCATEFLPLDVIPPQLTLPAMPVVSAPSATPEPAGSLGGAPDPGPEPIKPTPPPPLSAPAQTPSGSPVAELGSFAASLRRTAGKLAPWEIGYEHIAGALAIAAGLLLLLMALVSSTPVRVILGVFGALLLALALVNAALFVLARLPSKSASAPSLSSLTMPARLLLAAGAVAASAVSATGTALLAAATAEPEPEPVRVAIQQNSAPTAAPQKPEIPPEQRADFKLKRDGRSPVSGGVLTVSPAFRSDDGAFDLIVHFHGNTQLVEESIGAVKLNALVLVVNLGTGSGVYEDKYIQPAIFDDTLTRVRDTIEKRGLKNAKLRRLALSSWSAGYGAIAKIVDSKKNFDRIDALLMLDGLHAAYMDPKTKTGIDKTRIGPFVRFAKEATQGRKLFSITHGDTETYGYASTGEVANALLEEVGATRSAASGSPPKVTFASAVGVVPKHAERWLDQTTEARAGGMRVRGYEGKTPEHHMAHLIQMSVTVLPELAERWQ